MKHGILIIAHNNVEVVQSAIRMLDNPDFLIFLHVDRKCKRPPESFIPKHMLERCHVLQSREVNWGGYSFIDCILRLIEVALAEEVDYIHLLQGADLPLKSPGQINDYIENHQGKNFLRFIDEAEKFIKYKYCCRHFFVDNKYYRKYKLCKIIDSALAILQKPFVKLEKNIYYGSSCFTITSDFARYVLSKEKEIRKKYRYSLAGDEMFMHNIFMNSPYVDTLYGTDAVRLIDWRRREGNSPHTFTMNDYDLLLDAIRQENILFARKFNENRDIEIVRRIEELVNNLEYLE